MTCRRTDFDRRLLLGAGAAGLIAGREALVPRALAAETSPSRAPPQVPPGGKTLSRILAEYIAGFDLGSCPEDVIARARVAFTDSIGVMLAGSREHVSAILLDLVKAEGSAPTATIVGQSLRASPQLAALANGVAGHAMDYDFTYISGQAVSAVIPAILPVAETTGASAAECLAAFIVGCEVGSRVVRSNFHASLEGGWHTTGMVGVIAAAAACARLLKLPLDAIPDALGMATSLAGGVSANFGTMTKPLHAGNAARNGVMAALLGRGGFTAHPRAFEHPAGYFADFGRGLDVSYEPFTDLGTRYDLVRMGYSIKAYPSGGLTHTAIEAALALRERVASRLDDIAGVHCLVTKNAASHAGTQWPTKVEDAKFSVAYLVAYALVHGAPRISAFTQEALGDEKVRALAAKVTAGVDPSLGPGTGSSPAVVTITSRSGDVLEQRRDYATGSPQTPMSQAQIEGKFMDCALRSMPAPEARKILALLNAMPADGPLAALWPLLARA